MMMRNKLHSGEMMNLTQHSLLLSFFLSQNFSVAIGGDCRRNDVKTETLREDNRWRAKCKKMGYRMVCEIRNKKKKVHERGHVW